ncbi:MAG: S41 family peptidase [Thermoguttaceae bacterium]|jgi:carboxyl-terminal processing protease
MPRRNLLWLILASLVCVICYQKVQSNRYGRLLGDTLDHVSRRYFEPVDNLSLFQSAMKGMMGSLDKNSAYIAPAQKKQFDELVTREFGGVGMEVTLDQKTKQLTVISPMVGSPAYEAGIQAGDKVLKIEGRTTQGMSLEDAVELMHGTPGTPVSLSVLHEGQSQPVEIKILRRIIQADTVLGDTRNANGSWDFFLAGRNRVGYLRLTSFAEAERSDSGVKTTVADLHAALEWLSGRNLRGLILDLRDNPGGSLRAAVDVCDMFIPSGVIVTTRGREGRIVRTHSASGKGQYTDFPMAVLVNENSASASEIVAACLQDHHRAVIVGRRSYGKGTVQEVSDLGEQCGELKLTVATYWRPSGRNIHRGASSKDGAWGVMPDDGYDVPLAAAEQTQLHLARQHRDIALPAAADGGPTPFVDRQLARAVEYVDKAAR